jgi:hypothetical protein
MEWINFPKQADKQAMIDFLLSYKLKPYSGNRMLDTSNKQWLTWPGDIVWKKDGF